MAAAIGMRGSLARPGEAAGGAPLAPVRLQRSREEDVRRFIVEADRRV